MDILKTTLNGLFFGSIGTVLGGLIGISLNNITNKFLSFILSLASGLMLSIICFDLIPEASKISNISTILLGIILGTIAMIICDIEVQNKLIKNKKNINSLLKTGILVSIGLALHNIPEGLAIGTGFESSAKLGLALALTIAIHDIPEGISMSAPLEKSGLSKSKIILYTLLSGVATGLGAFVGCLIGKISPYIISFSLSLAAGAMLYIVTGELTPEYSKLYSGKITALGNIFGFILGYLAIHICQ